MPAKQKVKSNKKQVTSKKIVTASVKASKPALPRASKPSGLSVPVYSLAGKTSTTLSLPKEFFGVDVNKGLLAQAVRIYTTNQKTFTASTKGRGEVEGSTVKIFRQKGTGRARHGSIRAPIFVGGGIVFGPKPRKVRLVLPKKMRRSALISALSSKASDKSVLGLTGLEKASGKTKEIVKLMSLVTGSQTKSALIVTADKMDNVVRATRNIPSINVLPANGLNAYEVLKHEMLLLTKETIERLGKKESSEEKESKVKKPRKEKPSL